VANCLAFDVDADCMCFREDCRGLDEAPSRTLRHRAANDLAFRPSSAAVVAKMNASAVGRLTPPTAVCHGEGMKFSVTTEIELDAGDQESAYVTWLDVQVSDGARVFGTARVALVHVGEAADATGEVWPALHGTRLEPLHDVYFESGWYKDEYADGAGIDLLFVDRIAIDEEHRAKNLDLALVRRLCNTLGSGCQLAVVGYGHASDAPRWAGLGFEISTPGRSAGLMHMKLGYRHAQIVDATGSGDYEVLSRTASVTPAPARSVAN
jgi:hypothetical protein